MPVRDADGMAAAPATTADPDGIALWALRRFATQNRISPEKTSVAVCNEASALPFCGGPPPDVNART